MPYKREWIDPEVVLNHNGVVVYHTYRDNEWDQGPNHLWFTLDPGDTDSECSDVAFDVRDLPEPTTGPKLSDHPPFIGYERGKALGFATTEEWHASDQFKIELAAWDEWHKTSENEAILNTLRHAIDTGKLKPVA